MASRPSSSPPPSPPSASNSGDLGFVISAALKKQVEGAANNGVSRLDEKESTDSAIDDLDSTDYIERFKKYEADYTHRLMAKYFSKKTLYGGNIFDENMTIEDEIIKSSRWPCTWSYADPVQAFEDPNSSGSTSTAEAPNNISNGKHTTKKNA
ncbi:tRNA(Ile2) 2-agmatinylcytidine synthetase TiaS (tRNA(Ile2)-agm2C synthetase) like [Quillaja saponaria]|uniref:tRNA(Ile2) 2-agmatinylcytidine synthetase TiaS (tRNA(Ile2)-agm2C synthetase) like n=1 Tax=Quillaja saponaria TaxID=32244 RepID=A0AAD7QC42_QUISA|nr:tRNA(Ile2) 2-agmatinylcytidine synthetase TiaS (tRNA(Ile2)-agm2C synthetase) like [Quillaja saponaria]